MWKDNSAEGSPAQWHKETLYEEKDSDFSKQRMEERQAKNNRPKRRAIYFGL